MNIDDDKVHEVLKFIANKVGDLDINLTTECYSANGITWCTPVVKDFWSFYALRNSHSSWIDVLLVKKNGDIGYKRRRLLETFLKKSAEGQDIYVANDASFDADDILVLKKNSSLESILVEMDLEKCI